MGQVFKAATTALYWLFHAGWDGWSGLFAPLPYGDPYIAAGVILVSFFWLYKMIICSKPWH